ncbi:E3 ubiquitin-protein ligase RNF186 [Sorex araneus]|uniref:E3 ubiquitin-protein ligase RNF186 n=1 Tax=Sorex araneus TaxID=42254 RepID=UPI00033158CA|nr:E3 ubiquitin-protein ligase RNF186 [Sorex araneus]
MAQAEDARQPAEQRPPPTSAPATAGFTGGPRGCSQEDLECLVCREPYSWARPPKMLGCQHPFCVVCLKLLLCVRDDSWTVTCPLCRQATIVPGGLICSLRDQEALVGQLARSCAEVRLCPQELADPVTSATGLPTLAGEDGQGSASANRVAARRLAAHLLLLVLLIIFILPFVYPGVIRWVLIFIIILALLMSTLFCCPFSSQSSCWAPPRTVFCRGQKPSEVSSIA